jgi:hypothetical protein
MKAPRHIVLVTRVPGADRRVGARETIPHWSTMSRLALGAWTFAMPCFAAVLSVLSLASGTEVPPVLLTAVIILFAMHGILVLLYAAFATQNPRIERSRLWWQMALVLAGPVSIPAYWFIHVLYAPYVGPRDVDTGVGERTPGLDVVEVRATHAAA